MHAANTPPWQIHHSIKQYIALAPTEQNHKEGRSHPKWMQQIHHHSKYTTIANISQYKKTDFFSPYIAETKIFKIYFKLT